MNISELLAVCDKTPDLLLDKVVTMGSYRGEDLFLYVAEGNTPLDHFTIRGSEITGYCKTMKDLATIVKDKVLGKVLLGYNDSDYLMDNNTTIYLTSYGGSGNRLKSVVLDLSSLTIIFLPEESGYYC